MNKFKSFMSSFGLVAALCLAESGLGVGAQTGSQVKPGHTAPKRGTRPKRQARKTNQIKLEAAQAKRDRRCDRNLQWQGRSGFRSR
jgi:hypothetical protein